MNKKKIILLVNRTNDYFSYLLKILAKKIQNANHCSLIEISIEDYGGDYGYIEGPSILLIKNEKLKNSISAFKYYKKIPKF